MGIFRLAVLGGLAACNFAGSPGQPVAIDASVDVPDAPSGPCDESEAASCNGGVTLIECIGGLYEPTTCALGCLDDSEAHCATFTPSNDVGFGAGDVAIEFVAATRYRMNGSGLIAIVDQLGNQLSEVRPAELGLVAGIGFRRVSQGAGLPEIAVFEFLSLAVAETASVRFVGDQPIAIVASGDIVIGGTLEMGGGQDACSSVTQSCPGPGGGRGGAGGTDVVATAGSSPDGTNGVGEAGEQGDDTAGGESGGGGGAFGSAGGDSGTPDVVLPAGGGALWAPAELVPLVGGSGGGGGGGELEDLAATDCPAVDPPYPGGGGGGGGGAIQIVSGTLVRLTAPASCGIDAGGGGGSYGECSAAGGGGGAGGAILIEAPRIQTTAGCALTANGGGGGQANSDAANVGDGSDGLPTEGPALGGGMDLEKGGNGGTGRVPAGSSPDNLNETAGGGGGGGKIVLRATTIGIETLGIVSPTPTRLDLDVF